jgi:protein-tyrosine phosphatase
MDFRPVNFRDLEGLKGIGGRKIRPCRLLRSGELVRLSKEDKEILTKEYQLRTIVDLRGEKECTESPDDTIPGTVYHNIDVIKAIHEAGADMGSFETIPDIGTVDFYMRGLYEQMIQNTEAVYSYRKLIDLLLLQKEGALLFHCFAGKDRTGLAAAIILTILGVAKEDISLDYLKTNEQRKEENNLLLGKLKEKGFSEERCKIAETALTVKAEYLEAAYLEAEKRYGSFPEFIREALKVTKEEEQELIDMYLY